MKFNIPTREDCQNIIKNIDSFYCTETEVQGYKVEMYDYRLASITDFTENDAFELRGLTFVYNPDTKEWERNLLLNKFFNVGQTRGEDKVRISHGKSIWYEGYKNTAEYDTWSSKMVKTTETVIEKGISWMYEDVKHKKIVRVQDKLDGSVISFVKFPNGVVRAKSKMSFISEQAKLSQSELIKNQKLCKFVESCVDMNLIPVFELCSPENQIVLEYQETELILLQVRNKNTGEYLIFKDIKRLPLINNVKIAENFDNIGLEKIIKSYTKEELIEKLKGNQFQNLTELLNFIS